MGMTGVFVGALVFLALAVIGALLEAEAVGATFALARQLLALAVRRLPAPYRAEYRAEWCGELHQLNDRPISALLFALGVLATASRTARDLPASRRVAPTDTESQPADAQQPTVVPQSGLEVVIGASSYGRPVRRFAPYTGTETDRDAIASIALAALQPVPQPPSVLDVHKALRSYGGAETGHDLLQERVIDLTAERERNSKELERIRQQFRDLSARLGLSPEHGDRG